jgi:uncharacterized membrane protein YccC
MSVGGRGQTRERMLRRGALVAAGLVILALLFLLSGHWIIGLILAAAAVVAIWLLLQARSVR